MTGKESEEYQAAYERAEKKVKARMGFFQHLAAYLIVNGLLFFIWLFTDGLRHGLRNPWFLWPIVGWGIALFFHFLNVFVFGSGAVEGYTRRAIEKEMRKEIGDVEEDVE